MNTMGVSQAVTALQRHGRIEVATDPGNRRRKTTADARGAAPVRGTMLPTTEQMAQYLFEALSPDEIMAFDRYIDAHRLARSTWTRRGIRPSSSGSGFGQCGEIVGLIARRCQTALDLILTITMMISNDRP